MELNTKDDERVLLGMPDVLVSILEKTWELTEKPVLW